jgi:hypothetical protein
MDENKESSVKIFWIFGILQSVTLGLIIFFVLRALAAVGSDTRIVLSVLFPLFLLIVEYLIYSKK